jgi:hypothetical protein
MCECGREGWLCFEEREREREREMAFMIVECK